MEILNVINNLFWNEDLWLQPNITWNDLSDTNTVNYAQFSDLLNGFKVALVLLISRFILENYVFSAVGKYLGLKSNVTREVNKDITENKILEKAFRESGRFDHKKVQGLSKQLDWSERRIERWVRRRISRGKRTDLFIEIICEHTFPVCGVCYGLYVLWDKPWFWETKYFWHEYPHHSVTDDIWWYYMLQFGYFLAQSVYIFVDTKRKDFPQMLFHHILVIISLALMWRSNLFRIGSFIIFIMEIQHVPTLPHVFLPSKYLIRLRELQNMLNINEQLTVAVYQLFVVVRIIHRLVIFPFKIMYSSVHESLLFQQMSPGYYIGNSFLCVFQVLNIYWSWVIAKKALNVISSKKPALMGFHSYSKDSISSSKENKSGLKDTSSQDKQKTSCLTHKVKKIIVVFPFSFFMSLLLWKLKFY